MLRTLLRGLRCMPLLGGLLPSPGFVCCSLQHLSSRCKCFPSAVQLSLPCPESFPLHTRSESHYCRIGGSLVPALQCLSVAEIEPVCLGTPNGHASAGPRAASSASLIL